MVVVTVRCRSLARNGPVGRV